MFPRKDYIADETLHIHRTSGERLKKGADTRERKEECLRRKRAQSIPGPRHHLGEGGRKSHLPL